MRQTLSYTRIMALNQAPSPEQLREAYERAIGKGRILYQALNTYLWTESPRLELRERYSLETGSLRRVPKDLKEQLNTSDTDGTSLTFVDVRRKGSSQNSNAIYSNWFNGKDGVIVCHENNRRRDSDPPCMWPSEVIWQSFVMVADEEQTSPSDLRCIVRHSVENHCTRMVIWQAARENANSPMHDNGYREYLPLDEGFFALLGSVNGASTMRMLLDHKVDLGHKTIQKIVVFGCLNGAAEVDDFAKHRSFMLVLSNKRKPIEPRR